MDNKNFDDDDPIKISDHKVFRSKKFVDSDTQAAEDKKKSVKPESELKETYAR